MNKSPAEFKKLIPVNVNVENVLACRLGVDMASSVVGKMNTKSAAAKAIIGELDSGLFTYYLSSMVNDERLRHRHSISKNGLRVVFANDYQDVLEVEIKEACVKFVIGAYQGKFHQYSTADYGVARDHIMDMSQETYMMGNDIAYRETILMIVNLWRCFTMRD